MTDKEFWLTIRRALMMIIRAIEKKFEMSLEATKSDVTTFTTDQYDKS